IGADDAIRVNAAPTDAFFVAQQIAAIAKDGGYDVILMGKESIDYNGFQVHGMVGELLGIPTVAPAMKLDMSGNTATLEREIEGGKEIVQGEVKKSSLEVATYGAQVAAQLGTTATAIAVGEATEANLGKLGEQGIVKVLYDNEPRLKDFVNNAYTKLIATAAQQEDAKVIVLANSNIGAAVGSRLSVRLQASLATNVVELPKTDGGQFVVKRGAFSGKAFSDVVLSG
nr:hypothetical protein [Tanacetum cinerariifolium]